MNAKDDEKNDENIKVVVEAKMIETNTGQDRKKGPAKKSSKKMTLKKMRRNSKKRKSKRSLEL